MKSETFPLAMPKDLLAQIRRTARKTGLSMADTMRQSMKLGLAKLERELSAEAQITTLKPLTAEECRQCWGIADHDFDALAAHCARLPQPLPEDD